MDVPGLPFVDEHAILIPAPRDRVWEALVRRAGSLSSGGGSPLTRLLGTDPPAGFAVTESVAGQRLTLTGRHRFSQYRLVFELADAIGGTHLQALTYAVFPGVRGRAYRALVIGSRAHVVATNLILRSIRRSTV